MTCIAGLVGYKTDQGGNPTIPGGTQITWLGAQCRKQTGSNPATEASGSVFRSGYKSYHVNSGTVSSITWKNQLNAPAASHDSIVFMLAPLRKGAASGNSTAYCWGGSYAKDQPFNPIAFQGATITNPTQFWNSANNAQTYWHVAVWFGGDQSQAVRGSIRIKHINLLLQPMVGRTGIT